MKMLTVKEIAEKWNISEQRIRKYCSEGRIENACKTKNGWMIPEEAEKPDKLEYGIICKKETFYPLASKLRNQRKKKNYHGLYDYVQTYFTYSSCRMASNRLTWKQVESIFQKGKISSTFESVKVSDCIEVLNHFVCIDFVLDNINERISRSFIKKLHYYLMNGTVDERKKKVAPGEYRVGEFVRDGKAATDADRISSELNAIILEYESLETVELEDILSFHVELEILVPFRDGNGRVGRLIMFKECLRHGITPFIFSDKYRAEYISGLKRWSSRHRVLLELTEKAQKEFEEEVEHHKMRKDLERYAPLSPEEVRIHLHQGNESLQT